MILSEERQTHWAHMITDAVYEDDMVDFSDEDFALRLAKQAMVEFVKEDQELDKFAREKVSSLKRGVHEGTPEWDIMYRKYYEEERERLQGRRV
jgi:hypothetical protein